MSIVYLTQVNGTTYGKDLSPRERYLNEIQDINTIVLNRTFLTTWQTKKGRVLSEI